MDPRIQKLLNYLQESRLVLTWIDLLDILFIAAFLSIALVWLQKKSLRPLLIAILSLMVVFVTAKTLKMYLTSMLFQIGFVALSTYLLGFVLREFSQRKLRWWHFRSKNIRFPFE